MVVELEGGPCPSTLDAESTITMSLDDEIQRSEGIVTVYSHTLVTQDMFLSTIIVVAEL